MHCGGLECVTSCCRFSFSVTHLSLLLNSIFFSEKKTNTACWRSCMAGWLKTWTLEPNCQGWRSRGNHFLTGRPEACDLIGQCVSLFVCKLGMMIKPMIHWVAMKMRWAVIYKVIRGVPGT